MSMMSMCFDTGFFRIHLKLSASQVVCQKKAEEDITNKDLIEDHLWVIERRTNSGSWICFVFHAWKMFPGGFSW